MNGDVKIIPRIFGGIGNQLFCYAAARRLALVNNADLVIDDVSGFLYDVTYKRRYQLGHFNIPCRKATSFERLEPLSRARRYLKRAINLQRPFEQRQYIKQEGIDFDARLLQVKPRGTVYLEGYWQSEGYFKDVEQAIRGDLCIIPPTDSLNQGMAEEIKNSCAVALHVRWFDAPSKGVTAHNIAIDYYRRAFELIEQKVISPHYFLFSDDPDAAQSKLALTGKRVTVVAHNKGDDKAYADLWLMSQCRHFITANSSFSWWGAWLGISDQKIIVTPKLTIRGQASWGFNGLIPVSWVVI